jgi:multidrug efflux pump subunit AcrA (membrane-fusion protein)
LLNGLLAAGVAAASVVVYRSLGSGSAAGATPITATVARGTVLASVSATGNVVPSRELGLNFPSGGRLVRVSVKPGDRVKKGMVLAELDDRAARGNLAAAEAGLASAQANVALASQGATPQERASGQASVQQAQLQVNQARRALAQAKATAQRNAAVYDRAVGQARGSVADAKATAAQNAIAYQAAVDQAQAAVAAANAALAAAQGPLATLQATYSSASQLVARDQADDQACDASPPQPPPYGSSCATIDATLQQDQQALAQAQSDLTSATGQVTSAGEQVRSAQNGLQNAQNSQASGLLKDRQSIGAAQDALKNAEDTRRVGLLRDRQAIAGAESSVRSAQASLQVTLSSVAVAQAPPSGAAIAAAQAGVASAQTSVSAARQALQDTVLTAPADGTVASLAGRAGVMVSGGPSSSPTTGFIVLTDIKTLQVTAGFSEADAAKVRLGQTAAVTFDALPNQVATNGKVIAIDTISTVVSNVVTYNVTVLLGQRVKGVKPGMTASVQVTVDQHDGALQVPSAAVTTQGGVSTVVSLQGQTQITRTVTVGLQGDSATEITGGLSAGDRVVISSGVAAADTGGAADGAGGGGFGPGAGGGFAPGAGDFGGG